MASLPTAGSDWCNAGATTNLAHYAVWLQRTIQYLDPSISSKVTDHTDAVQKNTQSEEEDNNCSSNPCGKNSLCWNGEGSSFLCTCESEFPHGNPYTQPGCGKCQYDTQCGSGEQCQEQQCVQSGEEEENHPVPPEYVLVGGENYYISDRPLSWSLAQYSCMNREGELQGLTVLISRVLEFLSATKNDKWSQYLKSSHLLHHHHLNNMLTNFLPRPPDRAAQHS